MMITRKTASTDVTTVLNSMVSRVSVLTFLDSERSPCNEVTEYRDEMTKSKAVCVEVCVNQVLRFIINLIKVCAKCY